MDLLLRHGAKVNVIDDRGSSPVQACVFHVIISRHCSDGLNVLRRLVSAGALLQSSRLGAAPHQSVTLYNMAIFKSPTECSICLPRA